MKKRSIVLPALAALVLSSPSHAADNYPAKPVRIIVPVTAGGGVDTIARLLATHLRGELGQTFIVENKPGAGGAIGLDLVAKAAPDGYTLTVVPNTMTISHTLVSNLPYDTFKSFSPVIQIGTTPAAMAGRAGLPAKNLKELVSYAKANPGKLSYAGCDTGSALHLAGEMLKQQAKIDLTHVPYKGCADSVPNVLGGQVDLIFITLPNIANYLKEGRLQFYAVADTQRSPYAPDLPTGAEQGFPDFSIDAWYGMLAPANTPPEVIAKLNGAINTILKKPDVKASLATGFLSPVGGTPEKFAEKIRNDTERYGAVIKAANIRIN